MTPEQRDLLVRARESLDAAKLLHTEGYHGFAASRAYFTMFYGAEALDYSWDAEQNTYKTQAEGIVNLAPNGVWDEALIYRLIAESCMEEGKLIEAKQRNQQWFKAMQSRIRANPDDASLLHQTAEYCLNIGQYVDEAIKLELKAIELNPEKDANKRYVLSGLYTLRENTEEALKWAMECLQQLLAPAPPLFGDASLNLRKHLASSLYKGKISPERLLAWLKDALRIPGLHRSYRASIQYIMAEVYNFMNDKKMVDSILTTLGAPYENDWIVIGPFDAPVEDPFPQSAPFELCANLEAPRKGIQDKDVKWESWKDANPLDGMLDIGRVFAEKYHGKVYQSFSHLSIPSIAYSCIYVEVPRAMEVQVRTGSARMRVWLNDNPSPAIKVDSVKDHIVDSDLSKVSLTAGLNRFLVATISGSFSFSFSFRLTDANGKPIPGLKFVSAKEALLSR